MNVLSLKAFYRRMLQNKTYFFINIIGLTIGMTCSLLITLWINYELSFDKFFDNADRIFRIYPDINMNGNDFTSSMAPPPLAEVLVKQFPEVIQSTRVWSYANKPVSNEEDLSNIRTFNEKYFYQADSTFFEIFSIKLLEGNPKTALAAPFTMVLSEDAAKKYFGEKDFQEKKILGRSLMISFSGEKYPCKITGITENVPPNAHFHYNVILSNSTDPWWKSTVWIDNTYYTYILLREDANPQTIEAKLPLIVKTYLEPQIKLNFGLTYDELNATNSHWDYKLQALTDIHLYSNFERELEPNGNIKNIYFLSLVAIFLIVMACINYANLATANSIKLSKEIGIRKTLGSSKFSLQVQFFIESGILTLIALLLSVCLSFFFIKPFGALLGTELSPNFFINSSIALLIIGLFLIVTFLGGVYPALFISSFDVIRAIKGTLTPSQRFINFRSSLVIAQFSISICLVISAMIVYRQLNYLKEKSPGFNKENIMVITDPALKLRDNLETFLQELRAKPEVSSVSFSWDYPGSGYDNFPISANNRIDKEDHILTNFKAGYDFMQTFNIKVIAGRDFDEKFDKEVGNRVILNESAVKELKLKDPIGTLIFTKELNVLDIKQVQQEVVGVVQDFNFESLHHQIRPMVIFLDKKGTFITVKLQSNDWKGTVEGIENIWKKFLPQFPFEFNFVEQQMNRLYRTEAYLSNLLAILTMLIIFIASIGLLGLTYLIIQQRTKEISIRKVLGASLFNILYLLNRTFLKWILVAFILASPFTYLVMGYWLDSFAYRDFIPVGLFIIVGCSTIIFTLLLTSFQSVKVALQNPVKVLRSE